MAEEMQLSDGDCAIVLVPVPTLDTVEASLCCYFSGMQAKFGRPSNS